MPSIDDPLSERKDETTKKYCISFHRYLQTQMTEDKRYSTNKKEVDINMDDYSPPKHVSALSEAKPKEVNYDGDDDDFFKTKKEVPEKKKSSFNKPITEPLNVAK